MVDHAGEAQGSGQCCYHKRYSSDLLLLIGRVIFLIQLLKQRHKVHIIVIVIFYVDSELDR